MNSFLPSNLNIYNILIKHFLRQDMFENRNKNSFFKTKKTLLNSEFNNTSFLFKNINSLFQKDKTLFKNYFTNINSPYLSLNKIFFDYSRFLNNYNSFCFFNSDSNKTPLFINFFSIKNSSIQDYNCKIDARVYNLNFKNDFNFNLSDINFNNKYYINSNLNVILNKFSSTLKLNR